MEEDDGAAPLNNNASVANDAPRSDVNLTEFDLFLPAFHGEDDHDDEDSEDEEDADDDTPSLADEMMNLVRQWGLDWIPCWCHLLQLPIEFALYNKKVNFKNHHLKFSYKLLFSVHGMCSNL